MIIMENDNEENEMDLDQGDAPEVFILKDHPDMENEEMTHDKSAYILYHKFQTQDSCLSFDFIKLHELTDLDNVAMTLVAGSQAKKSRCNELTILGLANLKISQKTKNDSGVEAESDDDSSDSESDDLDGNPEAESVGIKHNGGVNRVRSTVSGEMHLVATWSDMGQAHIWDLTKSVQAVNDAHYMSQFSQQRVAEHTHPLFTWRNTGQSSEGYGMDWSTHDKATLASGDNMGRLFIWQPSAATWNVCQMSETNGHSGSIEDIQWSPVERNVLITCGSDRSIIVWDTRDRKSRLQVSDSHDSDVNVISWSKHQFHSLLSGGDDGIIKLWDLRMVAQSGGKTSSNQGQHAYTHKFDFHKKPITSIEWIGVSDSDFGVFAASSEDNQLTIWDASLEEPDEPGNTEDNIPINLLFIHGGQTEIKELHWDPNSKGVIVSTALDGFDIFRTISV